MKTFRRVFLIILALVISFSGAVCYAGYEKYRDALIEYPPEDFIESIREGEHYTKFNDIAPFYFDAVVSVEDRRFYDHNGFDIIGVLRAVLTAFKSGEVSEGGSTITQQLVKNLYFPLDYSLERKIAEVFMAVRFEKLLSKDEILELYANSIYFGSGYYNIYDASQGYYGKYPDELSEYEASMLAGVPNAPSVYSPDVNPDLAAKRQMVVLQAMEGEGIITEDDIERILNSGYTD